MATIANAYDPNNPNANANTGGGGTVMPSANSGSPGGSASVASASGGTSAPPASSTPYQPPNVSQYLAANQGAGQKLTQGITGNLQNQANQLGSATNNAQNTLSGQYNNLNQNLNTNTAQGVAQTAFQNPQQLLDAYNSAKTQSSSAPLTSDQQNAANQYNQFQQLNNGGYNQGIQNYNNQYQQNQNQLQGQLANLTQQTGSATNEMGRQQLLQNAVGQANYNPGEQNLDTLFLQATPGQGGQSNLQNLQHNLSGIGNQAQQQVQGFGATNQGNLANLQGLSAADQAGIKNLFTTGQWGSQPGAAGGPLGLAGITSNINSQVSAANAAQPGIVQALQNAAAGNKGLGNFTQSQVSQLGLTPGQSAWGVGLGQYINAAPAATAAGVADQATMDRYNALNQLAGGPTGVANYNNLFGPMGSQTTAGGYKPVNFDTDAFNTAIKQQQTALTGADFKNALNSALGSMGGGGDNGGTSMGHAANNVVDDPILDQIRSGFANGTLTPDAANALINKDITYNNSIANPELAGITNTATRQAWSPFTNYYNNQYLPASQDILGQIQQGGGPAGGGHGPQVAPGGDFSGLKAPGEL